MSSALGNPGQYQKRESSISNSSHPNSVDQTTPDSTTQHQSSFLACSAEDVPAIATSEPKEGPTSPATTSQMNNSEKSNDRTQEEASAPGSSPLNEEEAPKTTLDDLLGNWKPKNVAEPKKEAQTQALEALARTASAPTVELKTDDDDKKINNSSSSNMNNTSRENSQSQMMKALGPPPGKGMRKKVTDNSQIKDKIAARNRGLAETTCLFNVKPKFNNKLIKEDAKKPINVPLDLEAEGPAPLVVRRPGNSEDDEEEGSSEGFEDLEDTPPMEIKPRTILRLANEPEQPGKGPGSPFMADNKIVLVENIKSPINVIIKPTVADQIKQSIAGVKKPIEQPKVEPVTEKNSAPTPIPIPNPVPTPIARVGKRKYVRKKPLKSKTKPILIVPVPPKSAVPKIEHGPNQAAKDAAEEANTQVSGANRLPVNGTQSWEQFQRNPQQYLPQQPVPLFSTPDHHLVRGPNNSTRIIPNPGSGQITTQSVQHNGFIQTNYYAHDANLKRIGYSQQRQPNPGQSSLKQPVLPKPMIPYVPDQPKPEVKPEPHDSNLLPGISINNNIGNPGLKQEVLPVEPETNTYPTTPVKSEPSEQIGVEIGPVETKVMAGIKQTKSHLKSIAPPCDCGDIPEQGPYYIHLGKLKQSSAKCTIC